MSTKVWIGFSTTNRWFSRLIRWVTRGRSSHSWVRFWDESLEQYMVMQAELHGYETIPWNRWLTKNKLIAAYEPIEPLDLMPGVRFIGQYLGVDYDVRGALWTGLKRWLGKKFRHPASSPGKLMCSEAVCRLLQHSEVLCMADLDPEVVSPQELETRLMGSPEFKMASIFKPITGSPVQVP